MTFLEEITMNMNQLTQKTQAALQRAQSLAVEYGHVDVQQ